MKQNKTFHSIADQSKLYVLTEEVMDRIDELLEILGVDFHNGKKMYYGPCPVHGGDKDNALNLYHGGATYRGNWYCNTHQCHKIFLPSIIGFVRGVLSHNKYGWQNKGDKTVTFDDTVSFLLKFVDRRYDELKVDTKKIEQNRFIDHVSSVYNPVQSTKILGSITRHVVRQSLQIPAQYYIDRGYSTHILDKYDIGFCDNPKKPMYKRAVVPVYDENYRFVVGATGRSIFEKCPKCGCYHDPNHDCPSEERIPIYSKWKHSENLDVERILYNFWFAKKYIETTGVAILVESPGNVWRLEEAGIHNSVAMFGTALKEGQKNLLDCSGALSLILLTDNDEPGKLAIAEIKRQCEKQYRLYFPTFSASDIGEMKQSEVTSDIKPVLDQACNCLKGLL